jgi:uncharacterized protein (TIRG00374 family)
MNRPLPLASSTPVTVRRRRKPVFGWLRSAAGLLVLVAVIDYLVLPKLAGTQQSLSLLGAVRPLWVVVAVLLEALSLLTYSMFSRSLLRESPLRFGRLLRCDLTGFGASHLIPGGGAAATALRYRLLVTSGAAPADVTAAIAAEGVGTAVALAAILWITLIPAALIYGPSVLYVTVLAIGGLLAVCGVIATVERSRLARPAAQALRFFLRRLPRRLRPHVLAMAIQLRDLLEDRQVLRSSALWASLNWLLDAAALWVFLAAYGYATNPVAVLLAYCFAFLVAFLPITPGGLGVIEGVLLPTLLGFGVPGGVAVLGLVSWRLFQFWLPIPVAGLCYLSLHTPGWRDRVAGTP